MAAPRPKMSMGEKFGTSLVTVLSRVFVLRPLITIFSAIGLNWFNAKLRAYPREAMNMVNRIASIYFKSSNAWVMFANSYMQQLTGKTFPQSTLDKMVNEGTSSTAKEMSQALGQEYLAPMLNMMLPGSPDWDKYRKERGVQYKPLDELGGGVDPVDGLLGAERFLGVNLQFQLQAWMLHFIGDTVSLGAMKSLKDLPNAISWSYGVGWLSWLVMGTPFQMTISQPFTRLLNQLYRPTQLTPSQVIDAYNTYMTATDALKDYPDSQIISDLLKHGVDSNHYWRIMSQAGYSDNDAHILFDQGINRYSRAELRDYYTRGRITKEQVFEELGRQGWSYGKIVHFLYDADNDHLDKIRETVINECVGFYERGWIDKIALQALMDVAWEKDPQKQICEILRLNHADIKRSHLGDLTKAEVLSFYANHHYTFNEAVNYLVTTLFYSQKDAEYLVADTAIKVEKVVVPKAPVVHKLSKSEISDLYDAGSLGDPGAITALEAINYTNQDAAAIVSLWKTKKLTTEAKAKAAEEAKENPAPELLTQTEIKGLWNTGILSLAQVYERVLALNYSTWDAVLITWLITGKSLTDIKAEQQKVTYVEPAAPRLLSLAEVRQLYELGLIDQNEAISRMIALGYSDADITLIGSTWTVSTPAETPTEPTVYVPPPRSISKYDIQTMATTGKATVTETFNALVRIGYGDEAATFLTMFWTKAPMNVIAALTPDYESSQFRAALSYLPKLSEYELKDLYLAKIMNLGQAEVYLGDLAYTPTDADLLIRSWETV